MWFQVTPIADCMSKISEWLRSLRQLIADPVSGFGEEAQLASASGCGQQSSGSKSRHSAESGSAICSSGRFSASTPNLASMPAAMSISSAPSMYPPETAHALPVSIR